MQLRGAVTLVTLSADATLSDLNLAWDDDGTETGIILSPTFASNATTYTASVASVVARVTINATENDNGAEANYFDGGDVMLTDADGAGGFQIDLAAGANIIKVKVTAEDGMTTETYTVTVTRAAGTTLVSSLGQSADGSDTVGGSNNRIQAQRFTGRAEPRDGPVGRHGRRCGRRGHLRRHPRTRRQRREQPRGRQPVRPDPDGH